MRNALAAPDNTFLMICNGMQWMRQMQWDIPR
jgi:hypothetical protein